MTKRSPILPEPITAPSHLNSPNLKKPSSAFSGNTLAEKLSTASGRLSSDRVSKA
jgi:hypothetical protein